MRERTIPVLEELVEEVRTVLKKQEWAVQLQVNKLEEIRQLLLQILNKLPPTKF